MEFRLMGKLFSRYQLIKRSDVAEEDDRDDHAWKPNKREVGYAYVGLIKADGVKGSGEREHRDRYDIRKKRQCTEIPDNEQAAIDLPAAKREKVDDHRCNA